MIILNRIPNTEYQQWKLLIMNDTDADDSSDYNCHCHVDCVSNDCQGWWRAREDGEKRLIVEMVNHQKGQDGGGSK